MISEEFNVKRNVYDIIEVYLTQKTKKNKYLKNYEKQYERIFNDYRDENADEKEKYINENLLKFQYINQ